MRAVRTIEVQLKDSTNLTIAITASSDGKIRLYDISTLASGEEVAKSDAAIELQPLTTHDTGGARLTCLDVVGGSAGSAASNTVELHEDEDEEEDGEEEELNQEELEELYDLLDLVEEAKRQGVDVEGLSELEGGQDDEDEDDDDDDDDDEDVYGDSDLDGLEEEEDEEEVESEDEAEVEQESD